MATQFSAAITAVFSVTRSFRNHSNMLILCSRNILYYYQCSKQFVQDFLMDGKFKKRLLEIDIIIFKCLQQLIASLLNKTFNVFSEIHSEYILVGRFKYIFPQNNQIYPVNFASKVKRNTAASFISIYTASFLKYLPILPGNLKNSHSTISQNYGLLLNYPLTVADCLLHRCIFAFSLPVFPHIAYLFPTYCVRMLFLSSSNSPVSVDCSSCPTFCSVSLFCTLTTWWKTAFSLSSRLTEHLSLQHCSFSTAAHRWETQ